MANKGAKSNSTLQARIKKMMQSDEDVGKVSKASPVLIAKALDVFLQSMVDGAAHIAESRGARMLTASHIKAHIEGEQLLDFLKDTVAAVPALPPAGSEPAKGRQKRQRNKPDDGDGTPPKTRSRGGRGGARGGKGRKGATQDGTAAAAAAEATATAAQGDCQPSAALPDAPQEEQQEEQAGDQSADDKQTVAQQEQDGSGANGIDGAQAAVGGFIAAAALPGAEAEEEDYDT